MKRAVSVICYSYNHANYIKQALNSILAQETQYDFEIIIHDDASFDGTQEIIKEYHDKYPDKIKLILRKENIYSKEGCFFRADKEMLEIAEGKYWAICEGDDYWTDVHKLEKQISYMEEHPECTICAHEATVVDLNGNKLYNSHYDFMNPWRKQFFHGYGKYVAKDFLFFDVVPTASIVCRKDDYEKLDIYEKHIFDDMAIRQVLTAKGFLYYMKDSMSAYRYNNPKSMIGQLQSSKDGRVDAINMTIKTYKLINRVTEFAYTKEIDVVLDYLENQRSSYISKPVFYNGKKYYLSYERLLKFCYEKNRIFVYGAGQYGRFLKHFLETQGFSIEGFVVSDGQKKEELCDGKKIYYFSECIEQLKKSAVIVCNYLHEKDICDTLVSEKIKEYFAFHLGKYE